MAERHSRLDGCRRGGSAVRPGTALLHLLLPARCRSRRPGSVCDRAARIRGEWVATEGIAWRGRPSPLQRRGDDGGGRHDVVEVEAAVAGVGLGTLSVTEQADHSADEAGRGWVVLDDG